MLLTHETPDGLRRARHQSLTLYGLPDDGGSESTAAGLTEIARLARTLTGADGAAVNVLPAGRQVTLAATSSDHPTELTERQSFCATLLEQRPVGTLAVRDLSRDPRFADSPFVTGELAALRGYATAPLVGRERVAIGTLCVFWLTPQSPTRDQAALLEQLARAAVNVLDDARRDRRVVTTFPAHRYAAGVVPAAWPDPAA